MPSRSGIHYSVGYVGGHEFAWFQILGDAEDFRKVALTTFPELLIRDANTGEVIE